MRARLESGPALPAGTYSSKQKLVDFEALDTVSRKERILCAGRSVRGALWIYSTLEASYA